MDLALVLVTAPFWGAALLVAALARKARAPSASVFTARECVGYGGTKFARLEFHVVKSAVDAPANDQGPADDQGSADAPPTWARALSQLPALINVLRGDMAIVGPSPLSVEEVEHLRGAQRHYLRTRPGLVGLAAFADAQAESPSIYKAYVMSWSLTLDMVIAWDTLQAPLRRRAASAS